MLINILCLSLSCLCHSSSCFPFNALDLFSRRKQIRIFHDVLSICRRMLQPSLEILLQNRTSSLLTILLGRAIAQAVSRRLPKAAARVRAPLRSCGICGGQSGSGAGFLRVLRFPLPILVPPTAPHSSSIIRGGYNRPISGRWTKWTQPHPTTRN
jgi:hypothetical protein